VRPSFTVPRCRRGDLPFSTLTLTALLPAGHDLDAVVQPGVSYDALNAELKERGIPLFFPVDPAPCVHSLLFPLSALISAALPTGERKSAA